MSPLVVTPLVPGLADSEQVFEQRYDVGEVKLSALSLEEVADKGREEDGVLQVGSMVAINVLVHEQVEDQGTHKLQR